MIEKDVEDSQSIAEATESIWAYTRDGQRFLVPCDRKKTIAGLMQEIMANTPLTLVPDEPRLDMSYLATELSKRDRLLGKVEQALENLNVPDYLDRKLLGDLLQEIANLYEDENA